MDSPPVLTFRKAALADADVLASLCRSTFMSAYAAQNRPEDIAAYLEKAFSDSQITADLANPNSETWMGYLGSELVAYVKLNDAAAQSDLREAGSMEIERIYVAAAWQGRQFGAALLQLAERRGLEKGWQHLWLGVWKENTSAVRFYERNGFRISGTHQFLLGDDLQEDWIMRKDLH